MVLKLAIAEDDPKCAADLRSFVERYCQEHDLELQIQMFPDGMELVENYRPVWDVLLLDIEMPHLDGMKAAERIRTVDPAVLIIFITYMGKFAIRGYEVSAMDFVLKPVNYSKLAMRLRHVASVQRDEVDLYTIVGNILDNAVEGAAQLPDPEQRTISFMAFSRAGLVFLQVENYYQGELQFDGDLPRTSKPDTDYHGFGLKSIQSVAEKYGGFLTVQAEDHIFLLRVTLPVAENR